MNIYLKIFLWILGFIVVFVLSVIGFLVYQNSANKIKPSTNELTKYNPAIADTLYHYLHDHMRNKAYVSIGIVDGDSVTYVGVKRENDQLKSVDIRDSIFQIGSISKVFTSSILAQMVVDGDILLEDNIDQYLNFPLHQDLKITFKSLSNHTSGLERMPSDVIKNMFLNLDNPYASYTDAWMENFLKTKITIDIDKKGKSEYSNLGVAILGYTLAKIKKTSYEDLCKKYIFEKYKMDHTFINNEFNNSKIIQSYQLETNVGPIWDLNIFAPAGGIASDMKDMILFAKKEFEIENKANILTQNSTVKRNDKMSCGLGWMIIQKKDGRELLWHNGATEGYTSSILVDKNGKKAVIILSTIDSADADGQLDKLVHALLP
jgi:CubicO group peptidase (beta-lactamase class C family)